jgi:1,4-alpha-glucan branching enzyme
VVCNFSGESHFGYRVGAPFAGRWEECVNTDAAEYGGSGLGNLGGASTQPVPWQGRAQSLELTLPASATLVFAFRG